MAEPVRSEQDRSVTRRTVLTEIPIILDSEHSFVNFREHTGTNILTPTTTTPSPSPDELAIQRRGRRHIPIVFSPDIDTIKQRSGVSSTELNNSSLNKSLTVLENTSRKRLFCDLETPSPENYTSGPSGSKKLHCEPKVKLPEDVCFLSAMQALTSDQLISIIRQVVDDHPEVEKEIRSYFPMADLKPLEERINNLRRNINRGLPSTRQFPKTDSSCYNRVSLHILEFRKYVIDQGRRLIKSQQWPVVVKYMFMAWEHVRSTPVWDNPSHNTARRLCFKSLSEICVIALKNMKKTLDEQTAESYRKQLEILYYDSKEDIEPCLQQLNVEEKCN